MPNIFKKLCLFLTLLFILSVYTDGQETFIDHGFEEGLPPEWIVYNEGGSANQWEIVNSSFWSMTGDRAIILQKEIDGNDWLISSQIHLQETSSLSFWATELIESNSSEVTIWMSTTGNEITDFTINLSDILVTYQAYNDNGYIYSEYEIDLSAYQGENVYFAWQLCSESDEGYCLIDNIATKYTAENIEWSKIVKDFWNESIYPISDGGYISTGSYDGDLAIQKLDTNGVVEWTTLTNGNLDGDLGQSIVETFNNEDGPSGFIVSGQRSMVGDFNMLIWVCKYDRTGLLEWENDFGLSNTQNEGTSIKQTNDGGYIITGYEGSENSQIILIKLDENGNEEWIKRFGNNNNDYASEVIQTAEGGFAITGYIKGTPTSNGDIFLLKTDKNGNEEFLTEYIGDDFARADGICQTKDGGYLIAGFNNETIRDWRIIKTNYFGTIEWEYSTGGTGEDVPRSVIQTAEGNYIIAGGKFTNDKERMYIVKLNSLGELIYQTEYETSAGQSRIKEIHQTHDGGYIFTAMSSAFSGDIDGFIAKTESEETEISQNDILSFYLNEQIEEAIIDEINHTISIKINPQADLTELKPTIFTSPQSRIFPRSATSQDFSGNITYTVTALDQTQQNWTVTVENDNPVELNSINNNVSIKPNPSCGIFTIVSSDAAFANQTIIEIMNIAGTIIYSNKLHSLTSASIDISYQPSGLYFITIKSGEEYHVNKIIIN